MFHKDNNGENQTIDSASLAGTDASATEQTELEPDATVDTNTDESDSSTDNDDNDDDENTDTAISFNRTYVEKLRRENAGYRERANRADELAQRLHTALVAATGRMADPTDLVFDSAHLDDEQSLTTAIDKLLAAKPHLASRRPFGDVGQGNRGPATDAPVNLADLLRSRA